MPMREQSRIKADTVAEECTCDECPAPAPDVAPAGTTDDDDKPASPALSQLIEQAVELRRRWPQFTGDAGLVVFRAMLDSAGMAYRPCPDCGGPLCEGFCVRDCVESEVECWPTGRPASPAAETGNGYLPTWDNNTFPIPAPAPEPSAPLKCEPWCGGDLSPGTGREFCKCMDVDRYFCTPACMAAEQPMRPCQPVPAHEAWKLRRMANSWKEHAEQVADGLARRFNPPPAPPAGVPVCKAWCGTERDEPGCLNYCTNECGIAGRPLNPPPSDPVTVATGGFYVEDTTCRADSALWWKPNRSGYTVDLNEAGIYPATFVPPRPTDRMVPVEVARALGRPVVDRDELRIALAEAQPVATGGVPVGYRPGAGWSAGRECHPGSDTSVWCEDHLREADYVRRNEDGNIVEGACADHAIKAGALVPIDTARSFPPGPVPVRSTEDLLRSLAKPRTTVKRFASELKARISRVEVSFAQPGQEQWVSGAHYIQGVVDALLSDYDVRDPEDILRPTKAVAPPAAPASEPAVRPFNRIAALEAEFAEARCQRRVDRKELDRSREDVRQLTSMLSDAALEGGRVVDERDAARAEVEQLRGKLAANAVDVAERARAAANNRAADAFREWKLARGEFAPLNWKEFEAWLRSGEDAPGAVGK